ncbi:MAG TPA: restriction endonuclease, partial [Agitococcus sp.]|nr:restriction endonuclease [Agitococcus sp.]
MTIIEAIKKVLREAKRPLNHKEIYQEIINNQYYSFGAKDPVAVVRGEIRKHCYGIDFPSASPKKIFALSKINNKESLPRYEVWDGNIDKIESIKIDEKETLPEEVIYKKYQEHLTIVKAQLLDYIKSADPAFFEKLVVELLLKMGYGWNGSSAGMVLGGAGDEGIDGIISEDKLGLEKIYIQAKRYKDNNVQPSHIRDFIG